MKYGVDALHRRQKAAPKAIRSGPFFINDVEREKWKSNLLHF
jgi:hypothetical protein